MMPHIIRTIPCTHANDLAIAKMRKCASAKANKRKKQMRHKSHLALLWLWLLGYEVIMDCVMPALGALYFNNDTLFIPNITFINSQIKIILTLKCTLVNIFIHHHLPLLQISLSLSLYSSFSHSNYDHKCFIIIPHIWNKAMIISVKFYLRFHRY